MIEPDREWQTWREWLDGEQLDGEPTPSQTIRAEVVEMLSFRKIWQGFAMIYDAAPEQARKNATFVWWLRWNYARSMGYGLGHPSTDRRPRRCCFSRPSDRPSLALSDRADPDAFHQHAKNQRARHGEWMVR